MPKTRIIKNRKLSNGDLFAVLNLLDYSTTYLLITTGGEELMPLGASVIDGYGMLGLLFYKLVVTLIVIFCSKRLFTESLWSLLNGAFAGVVIWNNVGLFLSVFFS
jgi:hypothetical protein|tara:strand:- start:209 stop:526 length:318 start_codon:yes stop_codon:yes gene_type:complete